MKRQERLMEKSDSNKDKPKIIKFKSHKDLPLCAVSLASTRNNKTGTWRTIKPIVLEKKCTSCLLCWKFCPEPCITMENGIPVIDYDYCKGCGICIEVCPSKAIVFAEEER
ncbi:MAG: 4Fe-4S binding protein [Candidatus Omnitrophota bacterium]